MPASLNHPPNCPDGQPKEGMGGCCLRQVGGGGLGWLLPSGDQLCFAGCRCGAVSHGVTDGSCSTRARCTPVITCRRAAVRVRPRQGSLARRHSSGGSGSVTQSHARLKRRWMTGARFRAPSVVGPSCAVTSRRPCRRVGAAAGGARWPRGWRRTCCMRSRYPGCPGSSACSCRICAPVVAGHQCLSSYVFDTCMEFTCRTEWSEPARLFVERATYI